MDHVHLTRAQIKHLATRNEDVTISAKHEEDGMVFVEPTKRFGEGKGKWLKRDGKYRD